MFNKSLDNILGTFTKAQADLVSFVDRTKTERDSLNDQAAVLQLQAEAKTNEIIRAASVIQKIDTLIN